MLPIPGLPVPALPSLGSASITITGLGASDPTHMLAPALAMLTSALSALGALGVHISIS